LIALAPALSQIVFKTLRDNITEKQLAKKTHPRTIIHITQKPLVMFNLYIH